MDWLTEWPNEAGAIVGYDTPEPVCPNCLPGWLGRQGVEVTAESLLDSLAAQKGIDRADLRSYDSDELPKPIFEDEIGVNEERCSGVCGGVLASA